MEAGNRSLDDKIQGANLLAATTSGTASASDFIKKKAGDVTALASVTGHTTVTVRGGQVSTRRRDVSVCWGGADPLMKPMGESRRPGPCPACLGPRPPAPGPRPQTHPAPAAAAKRYGHGKPAAPPRPAPPAVSPVAAPAGPSSEAQPALPFEATAATHTPSPTPAPAGPRRPSARGPRGCRVSAPPGRSSSSSSSVCL